mmetsp:Transcript_110193/g.310770  ORF Transcript_110193/g.310770 Transcript_110193/m.310770 type:complete len:249 (-) Transcript_110193:663-1409(-)
MSARAVSGLHEMYTMRWKRAMNEDTSEPRPARGGSTSTVCKSYSARSMCASLWKARVPLNAWASSSADTRASATFLAPFASAFKIAASTDPFTSSVASTRRKHCAKPTAKLPLPQYSSSKSSHRAGPTAPTSASPSRATVRAHASMCRATEAFGCENPPSICLYRKGAVTPATSRRSSTQSRPTTRFFPRLWPMTLAPLSAACSRTAASSHSSVKGPSSTSSSSTSAALSSRCRCSRRRRPARSKGVW